MPPEDYKVCLDSIGSIRIVNLVRPKAGKVLFNGPATILFWDDGEKTVVKCRECEDGSCIYDKDFEVFLDHDDAVGKVARCAFCKTHFDSEKAVMAAMLKRLYPNFQDVLREALGVEDG